MQCIIKIYIFHMQAIVWYMDTKVLYISKNTALIIRCEVNKK